MPEATVEFWLIKLMAVTMGETAADYLAVNLGLGLTATTVLMSAVLIAALVWQFRAEALRPLCLLDGGRADLRRRHADHGQPGRQPRRGADDEHGGSSQSPSALTFAAWFMAERTLSIHTIYTTGARRSTGSQSSSPSRSARRRETWSAKQFGLGYMATGILFGAIIASIAVGYLELGLDAVWAFWLAYIFTRPLGASFGDLMSQPRDYGGLGFGTVVTSVSFLAVIVLVVIVMTVRQRRQAD